nr:peptide deformylase [Pirellula sp.]
MAKLQLVTFPHPVLRHKSKPIVRVDAELLDLVNQMFEIMYDFRGVGLAANQVALPIRLFVANPSGDRKEK